MRHNDQEEFDIAYAEEAAIAKSQALIEWAMECADINQKELAKRLGVSEARVSQLLGAEPNNLSVKKLARILFALDDSLMITSENRERWLKKIPNNICVWNDIFSGLFKEETYGYELTEAANDCEHEYARDFSYDIRDEYLEFEAA